MANRCLKHCNLCVVDGGLQLSKVDLDILYESMYCNKNLMVNPKIDGHLLVDIQLIE